MPAGEKQIIVIVLSMLCLGSLVPIKLHAGSSPRISVEQPVMDLGVAYDDSAVEHCFVIENRGDAVLTIGKVITDCNGCLFYALETNTVSAGKSATLVVTLDSGSIEGETTRNIVLQSNDPETPMLVLSISVKVVPRYFVYPRKLFFGVTGRDSALTQNVRIVSNTGFKDRLSSVVCSSSVFSAVLKPSAVDSEYDLQVSTTAPLPEGRTFCDISISSSNASVPRCVVSAAVFVPPAFILMPENLAFKAVDEQQLRILFIRQHSDKPAVLSDVVVSTTNATCEINMGPGNADYRLYVHAHNLAGRSGVVGSLTIKTDDPLRKELSVPIEVR